MTVQSQNEAVIFLSNNPEVFGTRDGVQYYIVSNDLPLFCIIDGELVKSRYWDTGDMDHIGAIPIKSDYWG